MVAHGTPCLGPITQAGCGALCPHVDRGCYGCFGPKETPNTAALMDAFARLGQSPADIRDSLRLYNANAEAFREESRRHDR
jgi:coenzyme F420-reducing hydrogenase gamma subunit